MATVTSTPGVEQIGETAGEIWHLLYESGSLPLTKIIKQADAPRDVVMQALGWLAREGKLTIDEERRKKIVSLVEA
ncbi:MAG: winged helix-turn-helix domain-containing protein [Planctomycetota bacterium]|nr:winged helix-turn-helix domain-containing protein [Planctomycetota bacterium]